MPTLRKCIIVCIFILAFFLRFNKLNTLPPGLGSDEVSVAYNAYSVVLTGRDEHGRLLPVYFEALGDQKLPVIIYLTGPSIRLFGMTSLGARFPYAFLGSLTVVILFYLVKQGIRDEKEKKTWLPEISALLLAINPWHLYHSRAVYEVCIGLFFLTLAFYCFLRALKSRLWFFLTITSFFLAFYTYSMTRLLSPLLFVFFVIIYRSALCKFSRKTIFFALMYGFIFLLPFLITFFDPGGISAPQQAIIITSSYVTGRLVEFRSYILNSPVAILGPLLFNRPFLIGYEYLKNILTALSPQFYFVTGAGPGGAGIGTTGQFYLIEIIGLFVGLVACWKEIRRGNHFFQLLFGWMVITILCASLTINPPDSYAGRAHFLISPTIIFIALGWLTLYGNLKKRGKRVSYGLVCILIMCYLWLAAYYFSAYYFRFPIIYAHAWEAEAKSLFDYLSSVEKDTDYIVITKTEKSMYAFLLFYQQIPPQDVWNNLVRYPADSEGWRRAKSFKKYQFRPIDWEKDTKPWVNAVLVAEGGEYPDRQTVTKEIYYPTLYTVFPRGKDILAFPEKRVAYRIWRVIPPTMKEQNNKED